MEVVLLKEPTHANLEGQVGTGSIQTRVTAMALPSCACGPGSTPLAPAHELQEPAGPGWVVEAFL